MATKTISDVLEYLYRNKKRELAQVVIDELRRPAPVSIPPTLQPSRPFSPITPIFTTPTPPNSYPIDKPQSWMGTSASVDKPEDKEYPTITKQ